jgi:hypothetical protein
MSEKEIVISNKSTEFETVMNRFKQEKPFSETLKQGCLCYFSQKMDIFTSNLSLSMKDGKERTGVMEAIDKYMKLNEEGKALFLKEYYDDFLPKLLERNERRLKKKSIVSNEVVDVTGFTIEHC